MTNKERKNALESELFNLHSKLEETDYMNDKNGEAERAGKPMPYDPVELYNTRQPWRDRINAIEEEIKSIPNDEEEEIIPETIEEE